MNMRKLTFLWACQHNPTQEQLDQLNKFGQVVYLKDVNPDVFNKLSNLDGNEFLPSVAKSLLKVAKDDNGDFDKVLVMPIGSPAFLMAFGMLISEYREANQPSVILAHSSRESVDNPDGTKTSRFVHKGWIAPNSNGARTAFLLNGNRLYI